MDILKTLAEEFKIKEEQVKETVALIDEGNTIPFISRYRKEVTGGLDDATLRDLNDRLNYLRKMDERREEISSLIDAQGKLTPEITFVEDGSIEYGAKISKILEGITITDPDEENEAAEADGE